MNMKAMMDTNNKHGSPADRGSADKYYRRPKDPHYWPAGTYKGTRVEACDMTAEEIEAYLKAYAAQTETKQY